MAEAVMVQGTSSDAGKSVLATGLCRFFSRLGYSTAPFKSQNMSQNSQVLPDGSEMARSQVIQAAASGVEPSPDMNPVLLKPSSEKDAQLVVRGQKLGGVSAAEYRSDYYRRSLKTIQDCYRRLAERHQIIVIEGAGSPVEMNLKDRDLVNMKIAAMTGASVIVAADIDRGGVLASIVGTWELLTESEQDSVIGFVVNKFRGDRSLFSDGVDFIQRQTDRPVLGVMPHLDIQLEPEDSLSMRTAASDGGSARVAAVKMPSQSGHEDLYPLAGDSEINLQFMRSVREALGGDLSGLLLPHSDDPPADLRWLQKSGWADLIRAAASAGIPLIGLGASAGMLGKRLQYEGSTLRGLEVLSASVWMQACGPVQKARGRVHLPADHPLGVLDGKRFCGGRRCRMSIRYGDSSVPAVRLSTDESTGVAGRCAPVFGAAFARLFHGDDFRRAFCRLVTGGSPHSTLQREERDIDLLADAVARYLDMNLVCRAVGLPES